MNKSQSQFAKFLTQFGVGGVLGAILLDVPPRAGKLVFALVVLTAAVIANLTYGAPLTVLVLASGAFVLVIYLLWSSVQALTGESELTFEEAFSFGARSAEEEQKRAVLRALKDLEYERSVGKISDEDYHEYSMRYRAEAKRLIQGLEEHLAEGRKLVVLELERRLATSGSKPEASTTDDAEASSPVSAPASERGEEGPETPQNEAEITASEARECPACQTKNELDARFCKACGKSMSDEESQS